MTSCVMGRVVRQQQQATFTSPAGSVPDRTVHAVPTTGSLIAACGTTTHQRIGVAWSLPGTGTAPVCQSCLEVAG